MSTHQAQWRCRTLGMELGPMSWGDLLELARQGELAPTDGVRCEGANSWAPANSISELAATFRLLNSTVTQSRSSTTPLSTALPSRTAAGPALSQAAGTVRTTELEIARAISGASDAAVHGTSVEDEQRWFCRVGSVHYGPIRFGQLLRILGQRRFDLSPEDHVKHGPNGKWVRVHSIPDLMRAAGHFAAAIESEPSAWESIASDAGYHARSFARGVLDRIPSLPAIGLPRWLRTASQTVWKGIRFLGAYSLIIVPVVIWISFNVLVVGFPEAAEELQKTALAAISSPVTWFALASLAAYAAALWLKVHG